MRANVPAPTTPVRVVVITLDNHLSGAFQRAQRQFDQAGSGVTIGFHAAADWEEKPETLEAARADILRGDIILCTMLFLEDHIRAVLPQLIERREACDAIVGLMSAGDIVKLTRMGDYRMDKPATGMLALIKKLRGTNKSGASSGAGQMAILRRLPKLLKFVPGTAQDVRAYFLTLQYWLAGSDDNIVDLIRALIDRYASGPRQSLRGTMKAAAPREYPEVGVYHPAIPQRMAESISALPRRNGTKGTVGLLMLRSYVLAKDAAHYDGVISAMEARGLDVIPAFAGGLDGRPAIENLFMKDGKSTVDAVVNLTGFSLVGGPAYNDTAAAEAILTKLDRPYIAAHPVEFQTLQAWGANRQGLLPLESTMMIAIPELDGGTQPMVFGGRSDGSGTACTGCQRGCTFHATGAVRQMESCSERAEALAGRVLKMIELRRASEAERRVAIVLFNFPPNAGAAGTAQFLAVFESLHATLTRLRLEGYDVEIPATVDDLREAILGGNASRYGTEANVHAKVSADTIVARETWLNEIEASWGPAPGKLQSDGTSVQILGAQFGNVFIGIQPALGIEGDPMRLLFEGRFAPTHAFAAFYRWLREDFKAHAVLHFGTHGSLEFMPGKQTGLTADCWPDRLIGDMPNIYLYAANNPSEGVLAKRRSGATLVSYLTPALTNSGVYKGLADLKASVDRWRNMQPGDEQAAPLAEMIAVQAEALDLDGSDVSALAAKLYEIERELIPQGLHVAGLAATREERIDMILASAEGRDQPMARDTVEALVDGKLKLDTPLLKDMAALDKALATNHELDGLIAALNGTYIHPVSGGDILRNPEILPTGRNIHGFDPFRLPSAFAVKDGAEQAQRLIDRSVADSGHLPETVAMVLWGTDNLKSEGAQIAQVMALIGARPRFDSYSRLAGAELIPLEELGRPRIDVIVTLSGVFRDLLPLQTRMMAEAALLAAQADEPEEMNFVRRHALSHQAEHGCDLETAALRVFSNAEGAYGANVNLMIDDGAWTDPNELADSFERQKGFAYGVKGVPVRQAAILASALKTVDCAYQNLESVELGITTIDQYVDTLGGISRAVTRAKGGATAPVYIGDQTQGSGKVRSLQEQVALETRTRILNPVWTEGLLKHGYEGVRTIEGHVTTTMGWSATTGEVDPWVYQRISETYVLDAEMRERIAALNPRASARVANRLIEAVERKYWSPDEATLAALHAASDELEDRLEGVVAVAA
ncbi:MULTISPECIES: magnesium chelatase subunit H [unclassified Sphingomonas]|uniref:magnesium chelatase subunit H n=1 Tax=unclassified Sphingomonas TaxID=196159 RepID=UPI000BDA126A|nr:MAG: magnesium chelatase subunit H [Sphingomonas sp. 12-62-6]OYX40268.1 MAG: magnesium chelatase subunit H [Sphingomonas sp. 32-62-10]